MTQLKARFYFTPQEAEVLGGGGINILLSGPLKLTLDGRHRLQNRREVVWLLNNLVQLPDRRGQADQKDLR